MGKCKNCEKYKPIDKNLGKCEYHEMIAPAYLCCDFFKEKSYIKQELWKRSDNNAE